MFAFPVLNIIEKVKEAHRRRFNEVPVIYRWTGTIGRSQLDVGDDLFNDGQFGVEGKQTDRHAHTTHANVHKN